MGSQSSPLDHWLSKSTTDTNKQENIAYKDSLPLKKITKCISKLKDNIDMDCTIAG
jgi:hypothetical protein